MRNFNVQPALALALVGLLVGSAAAQGGRLGLAHVEDTTPSRAAARREAPAAPAARSQTVIGSQPVVQHSGPVTFDHPVGAPHGAPCNGAGCSPNGQCGPSCCLYECLKHGHASCLYGWLPGDGGCTHSPDYGFTRPVKYPIRSVPVEYHRYWPTQWYGECGTVPAHATGRQFPVVFTPTDTTQLGYYYQRVPTWRPNPAMIPPAPWPPDWHHREFCERAAYYGPNGVAVENAAGPAVQRGRIIERPAPQTPVEPPQPPVVDPNGGPQNQGAELLEPPDPNARYAPRRANAIMPAGW